MEVVIDATADGDVDYRDGTTDTDGDGVVDRYTQLVADLFADAATIEIGGQGVFVGKERVLEYLRRLAPGR